MLTGEFEAFNVYQGVGKASYSLFNGNAKILSSDSVFIDSNTVIVGMSGDFINKQVSFTDILKAGDYRFRILADPEAEIATSYYNLQASITTIVPVPASVWLFSSGLIGLFSFSRKNRKK